MHQVIRILFNVTTDVALLVCVAAVALSRRQFTEMHLVFRGCHWHALSYPGHLVLDNRYQILAEMEAARQPEDRLAFRKMRFLSMHWDGLDVGTTVDEVHAASEAYVVHMDKARALERSRTRPARYSVSHTAVAVPAGVIAALRPMTWVLGRRRRWAMGFDVTLHPPGPKAETGL